MTKKNNKPNEIVWSFFSGAMGLDLGLESVGLSPSLCVELDSFCCATIKQNRPDLPVLNNDIGKLSGKELRAITSHDGDVFLMAGGPPCQSFSPGGKRAALSDPRGNLIYEYLRLISEIRPRFFILENVANLITAALRHRPIKERPGQHWNLKKYDTFMNDEENGLADDEKSGSAIKQILTDVKTLGYEVTFGVLNAADFGAAQNRFRFVMIGSREGPAISMPEAKHGTNDELPPFVTLRDAIYDLRFSPGPHSNYSEEFVKLFKLIPPGKNWRALPLHLQREALGGAFESGGGKTGFFRRLSWDSPAPTITGKPNRKASAVCHPDFIRPISVRESARLQGFPDEWAFYGAMNRQYLQIGNAVPIELGRAIGNAICNPVQRQDSLTDEIQLELALRKLRATARNKSARQMERQNLL